MVPMVTFVGDRFRGRLLPADIAGGTIETEHDELVGGFGLAGTEAPKTAAFSALSMKLIHL